MSMQLPHPRHSLCPEMSSVMLSACVGLNPEDNSRHRPTGGVLVLSISFKIAWTAFTSCCLRSGIGLPVLRALRHRLVYAGFTLPAGRVSLAVNSM